MPYLRRTVQKPYQTLQPASPAADRTPNIPQENSVVFNLSQHCDSHIWQGLVMRVGHTTALKDRTEFRRWDVCPSVLQRNKQTRKKSRESSHASERFGVDCWGAGALPVPLLFSQSLLWWGTTAFSAVWRFPFSGDCCVTGLPQRGSGLLGWQ